MDKKRIFRGSRKPLQAHEKVCDENDSRIMSRIRKNDTHKNVIHGRKPFIMPKQNTGENNLHELLGNDYGYNEGTICVVTGELVLRGWFLERGRMNGRH